MNRIILTRINPTPTYTLGFIRHKDFFCFTLEPVNKIPCGTYPIVWEYSPKFKTNLWELKDVSGRTEIKVHVGNSPQDTEGCILLGYGNSGADLQWSAMAVISFNQLCHDEKITEIEVREV